MTQQVAQLGAGHRKCTSSTRLDDLPLVLMPAEVVEVLRLDEKANKDGSIKHRTMTDALRSLDHLHRTGQLRHLPGVRRRYSREAVLDYLHGTLTK